MRAYHIAPLENLESIRLNGLSPAVAGQPLHLAGDQAQAGAEKAKDLGYQGALLEVNLEVLDPDLLGPDDADLPDLLKQNRDPRDWSEVGWQESLETIGQVTYSGRIPYSAIRVLAKWKSD